MTADYPSVPVALVRKPEVTEMPFVLDLESNPHPQLREFGYSLRRLAREQNGTEYVLLWAGFMLAMEFATGAPTDALNAWIDRQAADE